MPALSDVARFQVTFLREADPWTGDPGSTRLPDLVRCLAFPFQGDPAGPTPECRIARLEIFIAGG